MQLDQIDMPTLLNAQATDAYVVSRIETPQALTAIRADWADLQRRDPQSGVFLSYPWIAQLLHANPGRWRVYVVRTSAPEGRIVCLFPAAIRHRSGPADGLELSPAGRFTLSDQTGFICDPDCVEPALSALAQHLAGEDWTRFSMRYEPTQTRARHFANAFPADRFQVHWKDYFINDGQTDYLLCPQISLPADFETYLTTKMGPQTCRSMRRALRKYIDSGSLHITTTTEQTLHRDLDILFDLWAQQWGHGHDAPTLARVIRRHRRFFLYAHAIDALRLTVVWRGAQPLGVQACLVDETRRHLIAKIGTRGGITDLPVGNLLFLNEIQWAIANGFTLFDLGHGNAPYKYSFGAVDHTIAYFTLRRRSQQH